MIGPEVHAPDFTEAVVGYRTFGVERHTQHNYRLVSPYQRTPWPTVEMTAKCMVVQNVPERLVLPHPPKPHVAPAKDCGCGIYAYFDPCPVRYDSLRNHWYAMPSGGPGPLREVMALMTLSGRIEVHDRGMRAQKARICALGFNEHLSNDERAGLRVIAKAWDVPLVSQDQLPGMASEYGRVLGKEHRPKNPQATSPHVSPLVQVTATANSSAMVQWTQPADWPIQPPRRYVVSRWIIAMNAAVAAVNAGLVFVGFEGCVAGAVFSTAFAGYYAGRRKEARQ